MPAQSVVVTRRTAMLGATALMVLPMAGRASTLPVPAVDRLSVLFLVDGAVSAFAEPIRRLDLIVERQSRGQRELTDRNIGEWGLSLLISSQAGKVRRNVLLDFGYSPEVLLNNARLASADFATVDAMVLSHGHYDHFGGLSGLLETGKVRPGTPLLIGGEEALCHRLRGNPESPVEFGAVDRAMLAKHGIALRTAPRPGVVADHAITTGQIALAIEHPRTPTIMEPGRNCDRALLDPDKRNLDRVEDDSRHELGMAYHVKGRGLVVLGSCSHRGILNTIASAKRVTGIDRLHAVIGGFHLVAPQTAEDARQTAHALAAMSPDYVVPGHCSGEPFMEAAQTVMPGKVVRPYVGTKLIFGAAS